MNRFHLLILMVFSIVLLPWIPMPAGFPMLRPEWFIMLAGLALLPVRSTAVKTPTTAWVVLTALAYLFSIAWGAAVMGVTVVPKDFTVLLQPFLYGLFFWFAASASYTVQDLRIFVRYTLIILLVAALIAIVQFFNPELVLPIVRLWADEERFLRSDYVLARATGTMGNPNDLGFLMCVAFALSLFTLSHAPVPRRIAQVMLVTVFLAVFATGSRTGMVGLVAIIAVYLVLEMKRNTASVVVAGVALAIPVWIFANYAQEFILLEGVVRRVTFFQDLHEEDGPWMPRVYGALETLPLIANSLVFGHGPAKSVFTVGENIDNEYILLLYRHGVSGLLATAGLVWVLALQRRHRLASSKPILASMRSFSWATLVAGSIFAYTAGLFMSFRLFGLLILIWTVAARTIPQAFTQAVPPLTQPFNRHQQA